MYSVTRNDVKQLAAQIEVLAKRVQDELDGPGDYLVPANELIRNSTTMVFALGEVYAYEQSVKSSNKIRTRSNRVYSRDPKGRFASK